MERQEPVKINNQKSSFDDAAVKKRSKGISKEKYQMKLAYEALKKENDAKVAKMEKDAKDAHSKGKLTGLIKGGLMSAAGVGLGALTAGASAPLSAYLVAGGIGAAGGYMDASSGSDIVPTGLAMLKMKMAADLAAKDPRNNYRATDPTGLSARQAPLSLRSEGLDVNTSLAPIDQGLSTPIGPAQPQAQLTPAQIQQKSFQDNLANLMAVDTKNLPPIPGPYSRQPIRGQ